MKTHQLKTWSDYFAAVRAGFKTFELRKDDRGFSVGDELELLEWDPITKSHTGNTLRRRISYLLRDTDGDFGLKAGYCVMGLGPSADPDYFELQPLPKIAATDAAGEGQ